MSSTENIQISFDCQTSAQFKVENVTLKPCYICGRTFNPESLLRHEKVCEKTKKCIRRNVFNSFSQRAKEIGAVPVCSDAKEEEKKKSKKWKEEHENILRVGRGDKSSSVMNNGLSQQKNVPSGYQQCPSCNRCFNQKAADRHIVWCTEQQSRLPQTPPNSEALERLKARVKYQAPLPKKKLISDINTRLVKSAESVRVTSMLRTHSSPPIPVRDIRPSKQSFENSCTPVLKSHSLKKIHKNVSICSNNNVNQEQDSVVTTEELPQSKKAVKFKEIFPVYKKDRNKNLDMLAALRLRLSELGTSDDILDDCFVKSNENDLLGNHSNKCNFANTSYPSREIWTSDGEVHCSTSSSSEGSFPSIGAGNTEQRMPRFCYNCGTKYPIVSAKFCCECGARRFIFGDNNNQLYAS